MNFIKKILIVLFLLNSLTGCVTMLCLIDEETTAEECEEVLNGEMIMLEEIFNEETKEGY